MLWSATTNKQLTMAIRQLVQYRIILMVIIGSINLIAPTLASNHQASTFSATSNDVTTKMAVAAEPEKDGQPGNVLIGNEWAQRTLQPGPLRGIYEVGPDHHKRLTHTNRPTIPIGRDWNHLKRSGYNRTVTKTVPDGNSSKVFWDDKTNQLDILLLFQNDDTTIANTTTKSRVSARGLIERMVDLFDNWPDHLKVELQYYNNLISQKDLMKSPLKPRWAAPCDHVYNVGRIKRQINNSNQMLRAVAPQRRAQRSIGKRHHKSAKLNVYDRNINHHSDSFPEATKNKGSNGNVKKSRKIKYLHKPTEEPTNKGLGPIKSSLNTSGPVSLEELASARNKLGLALDRLQEKLQQTRELSKIVADKLLGEIDNRKHVLNETRTYRHMWLPEIDRFNNGSMQAYKSTREKIDVILEYLQYFAVGFEQAVANQLEKRDTHLKDLFQLEKTIIELLCLIREGSKLNKIHYNQYFRMFIHRKQTKGGKDDPANDNNITHDDDRRLSLMLKSDDTITTTLDNQKPGYIQRSVMKPELRYIRKRIHRYIRDYVLVRDYINFLGFVTSTTSELTHIFKEVNRQ